MSPSEKGWWQAEVSLAPGTDYGFSLDGGEARPDPRSPWQPEGVHGLSRTVDHRSYSWADSEWRGFELASSVIYELHVGTFTPEGTLAAAAKNLGHLVDLGVNAVELLPVAQFPGAHGWGYDGVDLYAPHEAYGGPDGLRHLVDECHQHGLGVIIDVVYNHLGPDGNHLAEFGPYFTDRYQTPWGAAVNLDGPGSDEVRRFLVDNALLWLGDYHADGLRIDAVHALFDQSAVHFLEELGGRVDELEASLHRPLYLIAESDLNNPRLLWPTARGGYGLDAAWSDDFHHALHAVLTGEGDGYYRDFGLLEDVARALRTVFVYDGRYSPHRDRRHGRSAGDLGGERFLGYLQNHDQVGNRARGDRTSHLLSVPLLKVGAALVLTAPFVPMLFQGEEWGASSPFPYFCDHTDSELARAVSEGRRHEFASFGWAPEAVPDPQDAATFQGAKLDWAEMADEPHAGLLDWHRRLIRLRRSRPELTDGRLDAVAVDFDEEARTLAVRRGSVEVVANLDGASHRLPVATGARVLLESGEVEVDGSEAHLGAASVGVLKHR